MDMEAKGREILFYVDLSGECPFEDWLSSIKDKSSRARILNRIDRVKLGNFGDCRSVGSGVYELRIQFGPGYRVYFGLSGERLVILLCGGDKGSQVDDIHRAKRMWLSREGNEN